ncbi:MAG: formate--phosphoribosylaminoimidazolecarboxamide ligase [Halobacteriota archaeon]|nr:formate--phosphoribosylaminoimidazolecarboxamide ligase [Halobacteriota archaeon]
MTGKDTIACIASHSALNILKGAKDEGLKTLAICRKGTTNFYKSFDVADKIIEVDNFSDIFDLQKDIEDTIVVPHGSFVAYLGMDRFLTEFYVPVFGNKEILKWESDRNLKSKLLNESGIKTPMEFEKPEDIDRPVIVKFHGARGGSGYFIAKNPEEFYERSKGEECLIQELIIGTTMYPSYFHSKVRKRLEFFCVDRRYESDIDSAVKIDRDPTFTVVGNFPVVPRESLAVKMFDLGVGFVEATKKLTSPGVLGPFCLELCIDSDLNMYSFEFSGRIVAGTNCFVPFSPYSYVLWGEPMSMGRRIAREVKEAISEGILDEITS